MSAKIMASQHEATKGTMHQLVSSQRGFFWPIDVDTLTNKRNKKERKKERQTEGNGIISIPVGKEAR